MKGGRGTWPADNIRASDPEIFLFYIVQARSCEEENRLNEIKKEWL